MLRAIPFLVLILVAFSAPPADARIYCPLPEHGIWVNPHAKPKELSRLEIETRCVDETVYARMRAFTKCAPRDCKWGWTNAELREGGGLRVMLVGFLGSKVIDVRGFGSSLDAFVTDYTHGQSQVDQVKSYSLQRHR